MENRSFKKVMFFVAIIILIASILSLIIDVNFFLNKKEAIAQVLSIEDMGVQKPYRIRLKYYNESQKKDINCTATLKKSQMAEFKANSYSTLRIYYAGNFSSDVYLADYKTPKLGIVFFDLILIVLMALAVFSLRSSFTKVK